MILSLCPNPSVDTYIWLETMTPGAVNRIRKEARFPGGKGVHVALAIAELGEVVQLLSCWGGPGGQWIKESCQHYGVDCHGPEIKDWSRSCFTVRAESGLDGTEILGAGPSITTEDFERYTLIFQNLVAQADVVTMSGSWPQGAPVDGYAQLIKIAHQQDKAVFLDCTGEQLSHALLQKPKAVHLNLTEGEAVFGEKEPEKIAKLLAEKCQYAAITAGAEGLFLADAAQRKLIHAQCAVARIHSSVGSGDCLLAGLALAYAKGQSLEAMARLSVACGAANCIREALGMLHRQDVMYLKEKTVVRVLSF